MTKYLLNYIALYSIHYNGQKNEVDKLIIIYLNDERKGIEYGKLFTEKGYSNIYLLNTGFEGFAKNFPKLIEKKIESQEKSKTKTDLENMSCKTADINRPKKKEITGKITDSRTNPIGDIQNIKI